MSETKLNFQKSINKFLIDQLPRCKHGNCLSDWSGDWLSPDCGCNFENTSEENKDLMALLKIR